MAIQKSVGKYNFDPLYNHKPLKFHSEIWHTGLRLGHDPTCKFWGKSVRLGVLPKYVIYNTFVAILAVVIFFSIFSTGQTAALAHMLNGSNDMFPHKEVPFGASVACNAIWGKYAPNPSKMGMNRQFQA